MASRKATLFANITVSNLTPLSPQRVLFICLPYTINSAAEADHDTAASAVRNLNGTEVNGRPLRIDLADSDPFFEGKSTQSGRTKHNDDDRRREKVDPLAHLPPGVAIPVGSSALDVITKSLANVPPAQLLDILGQMKVQRMYPGLLDHLTHYSTSYSNILSTRPNTLEIFSTPTLNWLTLSSKRCC